MAEVNFDADIKRMQDLFGVLKHQYDLYFAGSRKGPPTRERAELEGLVRHYSNGTLNRMSQQFLFNTFASTFSLHCEQWNKWLRAKEEGLADDPRFASPLRQAKRALYELERGLPVTPAAPAPSPSSDPSSPAPPPSGSKENGARPVRRLYEEFITARLQVGMVPEWDYNAFESHLRKQREAILLKYAGKDVVFSVQSQDGKVSLKAKVIR